MIRIPDFRIIARLDIKNEFVIKGIHLEGLRKVGDPIVMAKEYYSKGADEIFLQDSVASLYGRNNLFNILNQTCKEVFVPIVIGGGLRSIEDVKQALDAGADRVAINSVLFKDPKLIEKVVLRYGSQCLVCSIEAKRVDGRENSWMAYFDCGREESGQDAIEWIKKVEDFGVGEILLTSIDQEGTKSGFDLDLYCKAREVSSLPIIASGGAGNADHVKDLYKANIVDGVAIASLFHYNLVDITSIKRYLIN